jgi:hypothetical protein
MAARPRISASRLLLVGRPLKPFWRQFREVEQQGHPLGLKRRRLSVIGLCAETGNMDEPRSRERFRSDELHQWCHVTEGTPHQTDLMQRGDGGAMGRTGAAAHPSTSQTFRQRSLAPTGRLGSVDDLTVVGADCPTRPAPPPGYSTGSGICGVGVPRCFRVGCDADHAADGHPVQGGRRLNSGSGFICGHQAVHVPIQSFQNLLIDQLFQIGLHSAAPPSNAPLVQGLFKITDQDRGVGSSRLQVTDGR